MGRNIKVKTIEEEILYQSLRREQNRINQKNFRLRKKIFKKIELVSNLQKNKEYKEILKTYLKDLGFNTFITLTTRRKTNKKHIKCLMDIFLNLLKTEIIIENSFSVIEKINENPHIHILLKTNLPHRELTELIKSSWDEGFVHCVKIYSGNEDYTLENYVLKEVYNSSNEVNWWIN